jgi:hypothetical protein
MGISLVLYLASDPELHGFASDPARVEPWLRRSSGATCLHEYWRDLDEILCAVCPPARPTWLGRTGADVPLLSAADRGAHGLFARSTALLLECVGRVSREPVEGHVRARWTRQATATGQSPTLTPLQLSSASAELLLYLSRLRDTCGRAVAARCGLLLALWEDW